jgi:hypothetical protein
MSFTQITATGLPNVRKVRSGASPAWSHWTPWPKQTDLLIPLAPSHPVLQAGHVCTASELVALLMQPAIETSRFDVRPRSR